MTLQLPQVGVPDVHWLPEMRVYVGLHARRLALYTRLPEGMPATAALQSGADVARPMKPGVPLCSAAAAVMLPPTTMPELAQKRQPAVQPEFGLLQMAKGHSAGARYKNVL